MLGGPNSTAEHWTGLAAGKMIRRMSIRTEEFAPAPLSHSWKRSKEDHTHVVHEQYTAHWPTKITWRIEHHGIETEDFAR